MKQLLFISKFFLLLLICSCLSNCKRAGPYIVNSNRLDGFVIGKETCNTDSTKDYWLIDFTYGNNNPQVGDTISINGTPYTNVLKTKDLSQTLKVVGLTVSIYYKSISSTKIISTGCDVSNPVTYPLKEFTILDQGEIR